MTVDLRSRSGASIACRTNCFVYIYFTTLCIYFQMSDLNCYPAWNVRTERPDKRTIQRGKASVPRCGDNSPGSALGRVQRRRLPLWRSSPAPVIRWCSSPGLIYPVQRFEVPSFRFQPIPVAPISSRVIAIPAPKVFVRIDKRLLLGALERPANSPILFHPRYREQQLDDDEQHTYHKKRE